MSRDKYEIIEYNIKYNDKGADRIKNIKLIRVMNDYTQLNVEIMTGISQSTLSKYENGDMVPTVDNLLLLAKLYGTSTDFLLDLTDEKTPYPAKKK